MYVDDSGNPNYTGGRYYVLSGIIIYESHLRDTERKVKEYKQNNFVGKYIDDEVHVYSIANKKGNFSDIDNRTRTTLLNNLYGIIIDMPITIISVGVDKIGLENTYSNWDIFEAAWIFIAERFDKYISENSKQSSNQGIIIVDKSSRSIDKDATRIVNRLRQFGSNVQEINHIVEEPMFISSTVSEQIQLADASAYCTMKRLYNSHYFITYWNIIYNKLRRAPNGDVIGYGLKIFPYYEEGAIW
jgi:hypothetical protein